MVTPSVARRPAAPKTPPKKQPRSSGSSNPLVHDNPVDTLDCVRSVVAFVADWSTRRPEMVTTTNEYHGLWLVLSVVDDALSHAIEERGGQ